MSENTGPDMYSHIDSAHKWFFFSWCFFFSSTGRRFKCECVSHFTANGWGILISTVERPSKTQARSQQGSRGNLGRPNRIRQRQSRAQSRTCRPRGLSRVRRTCDVFLLEEPLRAGVICRSFPFSLHST